ncbi:MAG TPA: hypothetical protein VFR49_16135, partial [Solirubrobacteraceae bacterium]|nr:hypothetical protein [Solirubrobacteraceae bacterium]
QNYIVGDKAEKGDAAVQSTLYVFGQFFGWREIIRREVLFLRFANNAKTREIARLLRDICETFLTDEYGPKFMVWRVEQRGIGERMIDGGNGKMTCIGYASFIEQRARMQDWLDPLERDLRSFGAADRPRLTELQHLLLELVRQLDEEQTRYPFTMEPA